MNKCMTLPVSLIAATCLLTGAIAGCSTDKLSKSNDKVSALAGEPPTIDAMSHIVDNGKNSADLQSLKAQLELQQQQLATMSAEQQALQEKLKRQQITLNIKPTTNANAGRTKVGTASTAYIAFLEEESQFTDIEALAASFLFHLPVSILIRHWRSILVDAMSALLRVLTQHWHLHLPPNLNIISSH